MEEETLKLLTIGLDPESDMYQSKTITIPTSFIYSAFILGTKSKDLELVAKIGTHGQMLHDREIQLNFILVFTQLHNHQITQSFAEKFKDINDYREWMIEKIPSSFDEYDEHKWNPQEFLHMYKKLRHDIVNWFDSTKLNELIIKHVDQEWLDSNLEQKYKLRLTKTGVYQQGNHNKYFVSVDLKKANATLFFYYLPMLFGMEFEEATGIKEIDGEHRYQTIINYLTPFKIFRNAKILRQLVIGKIIKKTTDSGVCFNQLILRGLPKLTAMVEDELDLTRLSFSNDELIYPVDKDYDVGKVAEKLKDHWLFNNLHITKFQLLFFQLAPKKSFYVKQFAKGFDIKGVASDFHEQAREIFQKFLELC
jgi:hypothetical protein